MKIRFGRLLFGSCLAGVANAVLPASFDGTLVVVIGLLGAVLWALED